MTKFGKRREWPKMARSSLYYLSSMHQNLCRETIVNLTLPEFNQGGKLVGNVFSLPKSTKESEREFIGYSKFLKKSCNLPKYLKTFRYRLLLKSIVQCVNQTQVHLHPNTRNNTPTHVLTTRAKWELFFIYPAACV